MDRSSRGYIICGFMWLSLESCSWEVGLFANLSRRICVGMRVLGRWLHPLGAARVVLERALGGEAIGGF